MSAGGVSWETVVGARWVAQASLPSLENLRFLPLWIMRRENGKMPLFSFNMPSPGSVGASGKPGVLTVTRAPGETGCMAE